MAGTRIPEDPSRRMETRGIHEDVQARRGTTKRVVTNYPKGRAAGE